MKKFFLFVFTAVLLTGFSTHTFGQIKIGASAGIGLPMGDFGDSYKTGFGGSIDGKYFTSENLAFGLNAGFFTFKDKLDFSETLGDATVKIEGKFNVIPILVTGEYYFATEGFKPYVGAGVGFFMLSEKATTSIEGTLSDIYQGYIEEGSVTVNETKFGVVPMVGVMYGLSDNLDLNVNLKYNLVFVGSDDETENVKSSDSDSGSSNLNFLGINVGVVYSF